MAITHDCVGHVGVAGGQSISSDQDGFSRSSKFASLWATKDADRVKKRKVFWVLMEVSIHAAINRKPRLSPTIFEQLSGHVEFKADFHHVYIWARKDLDQKWYDIPYLATDDAIIEVLK